MADEKDQVDGPSVESLLAGLLRLSDRFSAWAKSVGQTPMWMSIPRDDEYPSMLRRLDDYAFEHIAEEARRLTDLAHEIGALQQRTARWTDGLPDPADADSPV